MQIIILLMAFWLENLTWTLIEELPLPVSSNINFYVRIKTVGKACLQRWLLAIHVAHEF